MKLFLFFIFLSAEVLSMDKLALNVPDSQVNQGALVKATLVVQPEAINFPLQKLKGETVGDTLYFQQLSPLLKKEGSATYEAEVRVIFTNVPDKTTASGKIGNRDVQIEWNDIRINPVEATGKMLWADFTAPDIFQGNWKWVWIILIIIFLSFGGFILWGKISKRHRIRDRKRKLVAEFQGCRTYDDIVEFWKTKHVYLKVFPGLENHYRSFEEILFKYQFKPTQSDLEKSEVVKAYQKLTEEAKGEFRGI